MNSIHSRTWKYAGISLLALFFVFCIARCGTAPVTYAQGSYARSAVVAEASHE